MLEPAGGRAGPPSKLSELRGPEHGLAARNRPVVAPWTSSGGPSEH